MVQLIQIASRLTEEAAALASVSIQELGLDRLSLEDRLQLAEEIWDSVVREVESSALPEWQLTELKRRMENSEINSKVPKAWELIEAEALAKVRKLNCSPFTF
jgi:putative addiction module component (TIGR02574 family)